MEDTVIKYIELEDHLVDHSFEYPYMLSCSHQQIAFSLRSKKTYRLRPLLLFDPQKSPQPLLPLAQGADLTSSAITASCLIMEGKFTEDGEWVCILKPETPGLVCFQVVFTDFGSDKVAQVGGCDVILLVQNKIELRKLRKQTLFPRCIGAIKEWDAFLKKQVDIGYNAFHLAPIQQTGHSRSYYSISDQLDLCRDVFSGTTAEKYQQLKDVLTKFQKNGIVFFIDIVLNHTSFDSPWIKRNIDAVYTVDNTPILASAYELDQTLAEWGQEVKTQLNQSEDSVMTQQQFDEIQASLTSLVEQLKLEEYFELPLEVASSFLKQVEPRMPSDNIFARDPSQIVLEFLEGHTTCLGERRKGVRVIELEKWKAIDPAYEESDLLLGIQKFNNKWRKKITQEWVPQILKNLLQEIRHNYLDNNYRSFNDPYPFINPYFSTVKTTDGIVYHALNNGWVMNATTTENLVTTHHFYYLRRRVSVWGDLIRIRYGDNREDSPAWKHMEEYVSLMAQQFDGFRLDNLHGTPLKVARHMINYARQIKPEIIIFAELFTNSDGETAMFCRQGGINSTLVQLKHCLSGPGFIKLFHKVLGNHGNYSGSLSRYFKKNDQTIKYCRRKKPLLLVYDLTHDNNTYEESGKVILKTPICLLLQLSGAFVGSTKGFDQFYSHKINVTETGALYQQDEPIPVTFVEEKVISHKIVYQSKNEYCQVEILGSWDGWTHPIKLTEVKQGLKEVKLELGEGHYEYKFKVNGEWTVDSVKALNHHGNHELSMLKNERQIHGNLEGLRAKTQTYRDKYFSYRQYYGTNDGDVILMIRQDDSYVNSICMIANLSLTPQLLTNKIYLPGLITKADIWIQSEYSLYEGLTTGVEITNHANLWEYFDTYHDGGSGKDVLVGTTLPPGFACLINCHKNEFFTQSIQAIKELSASPIRIPPLGCLDYNFIMFGIDQEEITRFNSSNYVIPKQNKKLIFAGFSGVLNSIVTAKRHNNLSIPLFDNIREGNWLLDFYLQRLKKYRNLGEVTDIVERYFECLRRLPGYLRPTFFTSFIYQFCNQIQKSASPKGSSEVYRKLCLTSTQFISKFDKVSPEFSVSISAGLPHFSTGWSRSWGRDTFMSNELLLLHPAVYRDVILQYAATLRHGLIPNLLDFGHNPRYNCRDACWWFVRSVKEYARATKDYSIFKTKVNMLFLSDDPIEHKERKERGDTKVMLVEEVVQAIFQSHADGISFREWNAGYEIDSNMSTEGFTIRLHVDEDSGFIVGGNSWNCLTWMDKMGSSAKAGNKGEPATPRAGSPIELTGLLYHCLVSYSELFKEGHYGFGCVEFFKRKITWDVWADLIRQRFEKSYYMDKVSQVRYQGIYKDLVMPPERVAYEEFRLRPNALVALALAPQLFDPAHALNYISIVEKELILPDSIGIATLGSAHETLFNPFYSNNDESSDFKTAHGFSYHNGPEWVWLYGFYVAAKCQFAKGLRKEQLLGLLQNQCKYLLTDEWSSLPELTNRNGQYNDFSCKSQTWSISGFLLAMSSIQAYSPQ